MSTRTFDEIKTDVNHAFDINDAELLMNLAAELDALNTPQAEALASRSRSWALYLRGDYPSALSHYHRALALYDELGDRSGVAAVTGGIGNVHFSTGNFPESLSHYHRALALLEELGDRSGVAKAAGNIGSVHNNTGDYPEALSHFQKALALHEELGERSGVASATGNIGLVHQNTGDYPSALSHYHRALALHEELGNRINVARVTGMIGTVYWNKGDYLVALEHLRRALALHEELGDRSSVAGVTCNIGLVQFDTGDFPAALEHFLRALALCEEIGHRNFAANIIMNIGNVYDKTGDYPTALTHYHRALALFEELGVRTGVARSTGNIGTVHANMGNHQAALNHFHRALSMFEELGERNAAAIGIENIGNMHRDIGDYSEALTHYRRSLSIHEELGNRSSVAHVTNNILSTYVSMNSDTEAQELLLILDGMHIDEPGTRVTREQQRAILQERSGDLDGAAVTLHHALREALEYGVRSSVADVHKALRDLALKQNNLAGYVEHNNEYTRITEETNGKDTATKVAMQTKQREIDAERKEHEKQLAVLHSTLPKHIADRVARGETVNDHYDNASVIFLDIVGFTTISDQLTSTEVVRMLESVFAALDTVCKKHDVVKIKTIGDSYMAVAFPMESSSSEQRAANPEERAASAALDMLHAISHILPDLPASLHADLPKGIEVRIGMHSGSITAGVIGTERMQYDVWGDTVNVASRMESSGEPGRVHVSEAFALALSLRHQDQRLLELRHGETDVTPNANEEPGASSPFPVPCSLLERGALEIKGKGTMTTYWLESPLS